MIKLILLDAELLGEQIGCHIPLAKTSLKEDR